MLQGRETSEVFLQSQRSLIKILIKPSLKILHFYCNYEKYITHLKIMTNCSSINCAINQLFTVYLQSINALLCQKMNLVITKNNAATQVQTMIKGY